MIIGTEQRGDLRIASASTLEWPWPVPPPDELYSSVNMSLERAVGLPALLSCLYRLAEGVQLIPQIVYDGRRRRPRAERTRATDTWQWKLLHERVNSDGIPPGLFRADVGFTVAGNGNAYIRKYKARGGTIVKELVLQESRNFTPRRTGGRIVYEDRSGSQTVTRDATEILHVRGVTLPGQIEGISRVKATRIALSTGLKRQRWEGQWYDRGAEPRVVLRFPPAISTEQADEWVEHWESKHQGVELAHGTAAIGGGADVTVLPVSLADAQFVEANEWTLEQCAGLYGIPLPLLSRSRESIGLTEGDRMQFVTFSLGPLFVGLDDACNADLDLFPDGDDLFVESLADALLRPDTKNRYDAYKAARQAGWLTANEIRALENYPPDPRGDELQATPVGGAPNRRHDDD